MAQTDIDEIVIQLPQVQMDDSDVDEIPISSADDSGVDEIVISQPEIDEVMIAPPEPSQIEKLKSIGNAFLDAYRPDLEAQAKQAAAADPRNWSSERFKKEAPKAGTIQEQAIREAMIAKKKQ